MFPQQMFLPQQQQVGTPKIDPQKFKAFLPNINQNMLNQLVVQARQQGIPEREIQAGLQFINQLK